MAAASRKTLLLCAGLQSSGSTLVSYCFLQRSDTSGVLDAENDLLPALDPELARPYAWYKTTIGCFRLSEMAAHYRDMGWEVRPLLVVRDLRSVWASLVTKPYGRNGITAEDPPLRMRFRRFVEDWRSAQANGLICVQYEKLISAPSSTLRSLCRELDVPWDEAMVTWPRPHSTLGMLGGGNESFWHSRRSGLIATIKDYQARVRIPVLPCSDLAWLEQEFREFNRANGYPLELNGSAPQAEEAEATVAGPRFDVTRRYEWETKRKPIRWLLARLGWPNKKLIEQRSHRRAA